MRKEILRDEERKRRGEVCRGGEKKRGMQRWIEEEGKVKEMDAEGKRRGMWRWREEERDAEVERRREE